MESTFVKWGDVDRVIIDRVRGLSGTVTFELKGGTAIDNPMTLEQSDELLKTVCVVTGCELVYNEVDSVKETIASIQKKLDQMGKNLDGLYRVVKEMQDKQRVGT